jgi:hypothetical protein
MSNKRKITIVILLALAIAIVVSMSNPLRRSLDNIREKMLVMTPVGTSMEEVIEFIESQDKWGKPYINYEHGYPLDDRGIVSYSGNIIVGEQSIDVVIGEYKTWLIVGICVDVFWGFDEGGKLVDLGVRKSMMK